MAEVTLAMHQLAMQMLSDFDTARERRAWAKEHLPGPEMATSAATERDILFMETLGSTICRVEVRHDVAARNGPTGPGCAASLNLWRDILEHMRVSDRFYAATKKLLGDDDHMTACERTMGATHPCTCGADAMRAVIANVTPEAEGE